MYIKEFYIYVNYKIFDISHLIDWGPESISWSGFDPRVKLSRKELLALAASCPKRSSTISLSVVTGGVVEHLIKIHFAI